jgi:outer membrane autotransporter protein
MQEVETRSKRHRFGPAWGHARGIASAALSFFIVCSYATVTRAACSTSSSSASATGGSTCAASGTLSGGSPALSAAGTGSVLNGTSLAVTPASGGGGIAAIASGGGIINLDFPSGPGSTITLSGGGGDTGLEATGAGSAINANNLTFTDNAQVGTLGLAWATAGGTITLTNSTITSNVSGGEAGLEADTGGTINTTNTNVIFGPSAGGGHVGVKTMPGSSINMTGGSVQIGNGGGNLGLDAAGGTINGSGVAITVGNGGGGAGIEAAGSGVINLTNNSTITTSGGGTPGGELVNGGTINMTGGTVSTQSAGSDGFLATNGGAADTLNLTNVTVSAAGNSFHVNNGSTANMTLNGVTAVLNNGTVLLTEGGSTTNMTANGSTLTGVMTTNGGTANVTLQSGTLWTMTGNSNVTNLVNDNSEIDYTAPTGDPTQLSSYKTLTTNNYVGNNGTIGLNTYLFTDGSPSDLLVINTGTATGSTALKITNTDGPGAMTTANGILVVNTINSATTAPGAFSLAGEARGGALTYDLFRGGINGSDPQDWFLRSSFVVPQIPFAPLPPGTLPPPPPEPIEPPDVDLPVDPPLGSGTEPLPPGTYPIIGPEIATDDVVQPVAREVGQTSLATLHDRNDDAFDDITGAPCPSTIEPNPNNSSILTQRRENDCLESAWRPTAWMRMLGQYVDDHYRAFADPSVAGRFLGVEAGLDLWHGTFIPGHHDTAGLYLSYVNAGMDVDGLVTNAAATGYIREQTGTLNLNGWSVGAYWTHYGPTGWYLDGIAQATRYDGTSATQFAALQTDGYGVITSLEGGYPFALPAFGPGFVLEPQAQILWQHVQFDQANDGLGDVALGTTNGASGRIGGRARWTLEGPFGEQWQPYLKADLWRDFGADVTTVYSGVDQVPLEERATRLDLGGGLRVRFSAALSAFVTGDDQFALRGSTDGGRREALSGAAGLRYSW